MRGGCAVSQPIRAVYDHGSLRLLDEVELAEGQEVHLVILSEKERVRAALGDLLMEWPDPGDVDIDEDALREEITEAFRGLRPLSEEIIAERRSGR
jgi:predicted DNA-binding antitoxin AbrB/MazE fold protein